MAGQRRVTVDMVRRAATLVAGGLTVVEAAKELHVLQVTLRARFRQDLPHILKVSRENWERRRDGRKIQRAQRIEERRLASATRWRGRKMSREQIEVAAQRIAQGERQGAIAAEYGVDTSGLSRAIKRLGLPAAPRGRRGGGIKVADRSGKMVVSVWLPKNLVKRLDHERIDRDIPTRACAVEAALRLWLDSLAQPPDAAPDARGEEAER